jgi:hypothetical protein
MLCISLSLARLLANQFKPFPNDALLITTSFFAAQHIKTHQRQLNKLEMKQRNQAQAQQQQQQQQQAQQQAVHS